MTNSGERGGVEMLDEGVNSGPGRDGADGVNSHQLLRIVCDINFINCLFLDFPFYVGHG